MINKHIIALILSISAMGTTFALRLNPQPYENTIEYKELKNQIRKNHNKAMATGMAFGAIPGSIACLWATNDIVSGLSLAIIGFAAGQTVVSLYQEKKLNAPLMQRKNILKKIKHSVKEKAWQRRHTWSPRMGEELNAAEEFGRAFEGLQAEPFIENGLKSTAQQ